MPYPNEHAARVKEPKVFQEGSFRRKNIVPGVDVILGKTKNGNSMMAQAYRFDRAKFTPAEAKQWLKDHNIKVIEFAPASNEHVNRAIRKAAGYE
jgi:hypothetical protein